MYDYQFPTRSHYKMRMARPLKRDERAFKTAKEILQGIIMGMLVLAFVYASAIVLTAI